MLNVFADNSLSIGNTPLVKLNKITSGLKADFYAKIEGRNPAYSVKCRIGAAMIWDAEKNGTLKQGKEIIEATSGNTGIALCFVGASRGYKVNIVMPETMSIERRKIMKAFGANLILTDGTLGMKGAIAKVKELKEKEPEKYFHADQFSNPANPEIHYKTTGPEIWKDTEGGVDVVVAGVGTGGTITGITRYIKNVCHKKITSIAVEPAASPIMTQKINGAELKPSPHKIQGIGAGFIPDVLDLSLIDKVITVENDEAIETARRLAVEEGILSGLSCGAAVSAAVKAYKSSPEFEGKKFVIILPDSGERYLSTDLFNI